MASVFRVITRIIPLNDSDGAFEPAPFSALTDGLVRDVKVLTITEPKTGISYRIERIEDIQTVGPGETVETLNEKFSEKLSSISGFVPLIKNDAHSDSYDKNFKFSLPQTISLKKNDAENESTNSLTISLVKKKKKKKLSKLRISKKNCKVVGTSNSEFSQYSRCPSPTVVKKKKKKSKLSTKNKKSSKLCEPLKIKFPKDTANTGETSKEQQQLVTAAADFVNNTSKELKLENVMPEENVEKKLIECEDTESRELVINESEILDSNSNSEKIANCSISSVISNEVITFDSDFSAIALKIAEESNICEDSNTSNQTDRSSVSRRDSFDNVLIDSIPVVFNVPEDSPIYDMLQPLKKYFVSGECLICGFIPSDVNYNAASHMESHVATNLEFSYYKCACCSEQFLSPRNLYMHVLSREKTYSYMCDLCFLKFKRKHYLIRHNAKAHPVVKE